MRADPPQTPEDGQGYTVAHRYNGVKGAKGALPLDWGSSFSRKEENGISWNIASLFVIGKGKCFWVSNVLESLVMLSLSAPPSGDPKSIFASGRPGVSWAGVTSF